MAGGASQRAIAFAPQGQAGITDNVHEIVIGRCSPPGTISDE
jgi:hypothetical protein